MKNLTRFCLCVLFCSILAACSAAESPDRTDSRSTAARGTEAGSTAGTTAEVKADPLPSSALPVVMDQNEYVLYQNIFAQDGAEDYLGQAFTKEGVLARLTDYSGLTRYYLWGYYDATKCCDWQWEFVPEDPNSLPPNGSRIKMTGTMVRDEAALDGIWFVDTAVELVKPYAPEPCDVDMTTMNATLERVQILNMQYRPDSFQGKTLRMYGRVLNLSSIQDPYFDGSWTQELSDVDALPAIGTMVMVTGKWDGSLVSTDRLEETDAY